MYKFPYPAILRIKRKSGSPVDNTAAPEELCNRIVMLQMKICPWNKYIAFCTEDLFVPHKVITASIAYAWEKEADKIFPQIIKVTHAASRIILQNYKKVK